MQPSPFIKISRGWQVQLFTDLTQHGRIVEKQGVVLALQESCTACLRGLFVQYVSDPLSEGETTPPYAGRNPIFSSTGAFTSNEASRALFLPMCQPLDWAAGRSIADFRPFVVVFQHH